MSGLFISFEGTEGCGKSTQLKALAARFSGAGYDVLETREPGGTILSEAIRSLLQHEPAGEGMCPETELLLFAASRAQHSRACIQPAIKDNKVVLCDRFMDSTTVYQGVARSLSPETVEAINKFAVGVSIPDLTVLIDLAPEIGLARVRSRGSGELDRMERETLDFFEAVREGYLRLAATQAHRFIIIDGDQSPETLEKEIWDGVKQRIT